VASFLAIARLGSFRLAARELGMSQAAVSQQIRKLEDSLAARLIERDPQGCRLTIEGREFLADAETLQRLAVNARNRFRRRRLSIGAGSNIGIYLLRPYLKRYAELADAAALDVLIGPNPQMADKLACGDIDLAVMEWWDDRPGYVARVWRDEEMQVIVAPDHPWAGRTRLSRMELQTATLLGGEPGTGTGRLLAHFLGVSLAELPVNRRLGSTDAVKQWVKAGMGISLVLAGTVEDEVNAGSLVAISVEGSPRKTLYAVWRDSLSPEHMAQRFGTWLIAGRNGSNSAG
jgi:molybdate transport repressor ModE-like protein